VQADGSEAEWPFRSLHWPRCCARWRRAACSRRRRVLVVAALLGITFAFTVAVIGLGRRG
jgi:hypothetical protein